MDELETKEIGGKAFNVTAANEATSPHKSVVIFDTFPDSLLTREALDKLVDPSTDTAPMRNQINQFGGNETGLLELLPRLQEAGYTAILLKPSQTGIIEVLTGIYRRTSISAIIASVVGRLMQIFRLNV